MLTLEDINPGTKAKAGHYQALFDTTYTGSLQVNLDGSESTTDSGSIVSYVWKESNSTIATGVNPTVELSVGEHKIQLTITTSFNITKTAWVVITIKTPSRAFKRPVKVSSTEANSGNIASNGVDGNMATRWSSAYSDPQWYEIDLGQRFDITEVILYWENASAKKYQIEESNDGINWTTIVSRMNMPAGARNDILDSLKGGARYIRMYGTARNTQYGYSLWEFEVYGNPDSTAEPFADDLIKTSKVRDEGFFMYPNPLNHGKLTIEYPFGNETNVCITDLTGKVVLIKKIIPSTKMEIDIATLKQGIYIISLNNKYFQKLIVN